MAERPKARGPRPGRTRQWVIMAAAVGAIAVFGLASVTLLGGNGSTKFSSVASAIGNDSGPSPTASVSVSAAGVPSSEPPSGATSAVAAAGVTAGLPPMDRAGAIGAGAAAGHTFVSTATMTVHVADSAQVNEKKEAAISLVESKGGGLFGEETSFNGDARATITLKLPPAEFRSVLSGLGKLGEVRDQQVKTDDVTQQVVDLDARITAAEHGLDRMRGLLDKTSNLVDVANLEADVNRREVEVEQLRGQQQSLSQRVDLSTIVLTVTADAAVAGTAVPPAPASTAGSTPAPLPGFGDGLQGGWKVFTNVGTVVLAALGACLPFVPFVIVGGVAWRLTRRRRVGPARPAPDPT